MLRKFMVGVILVGLIIMLVVIWMGIVKDIAATHTVASISAPNPLPPGVTTVIAEWTEKGRLGCTMRSTRYLDASYVSTICVDKFGNLSLAMAGPYYEEESKK